MKYLLVLTMLALASCQKKETIASIPNDKAALIAREAAQDAFTRLSAELTSAIAAGGPVAAIPICSEKANPLVAEVALARQIQMRRLSDRPRNPDQHAQGRDLTTIESFRTSFQSGTPPQPDVEPRPDGSSVVRIPIVLNQPLCLQCHGSDTDIADDTRAAIQSLYPHDQATGYQLNDLRGIWRITIPPEDSSP